MNSQKWLPNSPVYAFYSSSIQSNIEILCPGPGWKIFQTEFQNAALPIKASFSKFYRLPKKIFGFSLLQRKWEKFVQPKWKKL